MFVYLLSCYISKMTADEINREIEMGIDDYREGKVKPMKNSCLISVKSMNENAFINRLFMLIY